MSQRLQPHGKPFSAPFHRGHSNGPGPTEYPRKPCLRRRVPDARVSNRQPRFSPAGWSEKASQEDGEDGIQTAEIRGKSIPRRNTRDFQTHQRPAWIAPWLAFSVSAINWRVGQVFCWEWSLESGEELQTCGEHTSHPARVQRSSACRSPH
jgi:hypothetical protein